MLERRSEMIWLLRADVCVHKQQISDHEYLTVGRFLSIPTMPYISTHDNYLPFDDFVLAL